MSKNVVYKMRAALLKSGQRSLTCYSSLNLSSLIKSSCAYTANVSDRCSNFVYVYVAIL